jgi:hypothetical protein
MTSDEFYSNSYIIGLGAGAFTTSPAALVLTATSYGSVKKFYCIDSTQAANNNLVTDSWDVCVFVGNLGGVGKMGTASATGKTIALTVNVLTDGTYATSGIETFNPPAGGNYQFKGTLAGTTEKKYVNVVCNGIAPMFYTTAWQDLAGQTGGGWMVSCLTGIPQCGVSLADGTTALSTAENTACLADPRLNTWRQVTWRIEYDGTQLWYRTDSYWNSSSYIASSTWGPGIKLSANYASTTDNNGTTNVAKTFVWAVADGSGVQLAHLTYATVSPTSNTSNGQGTNTNFTPDKATYSNSSPDLFQENVCSSSNLLLEALADTSGLASAITEYSDGYKAAITITLESQLNGALGGWSGACMVLYQSQYVQDNTNGALCVLAQQSTASGAGPTDFGGVYLVHVPSATWAPPAKSGTINPT